VSQPASGEPGGGWIGARLTPQDYRRLLRGQGRFADDLNAPGQAWARIVRSPVAHGRLRRVDTARAAQAPGVVRVVTAADLAGRREAGLTARDSQTGTAARASEASPAGAGSEAGTAGRQGPPLIPVRLKLQGLDLSRYLQPVIAADVVRYAGEPVAVVVAEDPYAAEDAAERVDLDFEELPAVTDARACADLAANQDSGSPRLFPGGNVAADLTLGYGDVDAAFATAAHVVSLDMEIGRHTAVPLETRAMLAVPDRAAGGLDIYGMTKVPVFNTGVLAGMLGLAPELIRAYPIDAGGGFGVRGEFYPEDFLIPWLARALRRPVKWAEDRAEHLVAVNHSRQQAHSIAAAFDDAGRILALRDDIVHDNGAYCRTHGITVPELTVAMLPGPYRVPAYRGRVRVVLTNKTPCGTYRAPGRFEGAAVREQLLDVAADRLGLDRAELRRRNLLAPSELPCRRALSALGTDIALDAGDYPGLLDAALGAAARLGYHGLVHRGRSAGRRRGLGLAAFLEKSGLGPQETAEATLEESGRIRVLAGATSLGQGAATVLAQIAADALGIAPEMVTVVCGDTALQPSGMGSWASRTTVVCGSAVHRAACALRSEITQAAAGLLDAAPDDLVADRGTVSVRGDPGTRLSFAEVARAAGRDGLSARGRFDVDHMTYPYGVHIVVVEVDPGTGGVKVLRYLVACEVGRAVNPALVEGQLRGGAAQGIGGALLEELGYDPAGQPRATTFVEYRMPTAAEVPPVDVLVGEESPAPGNPLGVRGAGEGGVSAAGGAIACAVRDALGLTGGVGALPLTPARVTALADQAGLAGRTGPTVSGER
jgi:carbon-monoxide dehydrogenase large subunit